MMNMHEKPVHNEEWLGEYPYEGYYEEYDEDIDSNEQEDMEDMGWGWPDGYPDELIPSWAFDHDYIEEQDYGG
jgi:hypothetical protein